MQDQPNTDLQPSLFESLWRHKWLIAGAVVVAVLVGFGITAVQPPIYQAEGNVLLTSPTGTSDINNAFTAYIDRGRYVRNEAEVFKSQAVATRASEMLGGDPSADEIQNVVSVHGEFEFDVLTVGATQPTAQGAIDVVNAVVAAYDEVVTEQIQGLANDATEILKESKVELEVRLAETDALLAENPGDAALQSQRKAQVDQLNDLDEQIESIAVSAALYGAGIRIYDAPRGAFLIGPKPMRNAAIAGVLALIAAGAWAWWREENNDDVEDRNAPAQALGAPLLGTVPLFNDEEVYGPIPALTDPGSVVAESYHFVVSSLKLALERVNGSAVVITSVGPEDGKTLTTLNVAIAASGAEGAPLVIDADQRTRALSNYAGLSAARGLTDLTDPDEDAHDVIRSAALDDTMYVDVVPAGVAPTGDAVRYFRSPTFNRAMADLVNGQSLVLIDAPPVLAVAETMDIARQADGVLMVVRPGTSMRDLAEAANRIAMTDRPILGYVYNGASPNSKYPTYTYGYTEDTPA